MNILIICSYFGPETSVGVNRVNSFTRHWLAKGCSIDVITMPFHGELPVHLKEQPQLKIHQVAPYFFSGVAQSFANGTVIVKSRAKKIFYWLKKNIFANYLDPRTLWWPKAARYAKSLLCEKQFQVVFTSVPSYTSHSIGAVIKYLDPSVLWVADYRDLWSYNPIFPGTFWIRWIERRHERFILKNADLLITINQDLSDKLCMVHGSKKILIVPNGVELTELERVNEDVVHNKKNLFSIVYTGTVIAGYQDPEPLFQAVKTLIENGLIPDKSIAIIFYGDASGIRHTDAYQFLLRRNIIQLKGYVSRTTSIQAQHTADLLLFLGSKQQKGGADVKGVITGKFFEYLTAGVEVMAIGVSEEALVAEMIYRAEVGAVYAENVTKISDRILALFQHGPIKIMPNKHYISQFDRARQANQLLLHMEMELATLKMRHIIV